MVQHNKGASYGPFDEDQFTATSFQLIISVQDHAVYIMLQRAKLASEIICSITLSNIIQVSSALGQHWGGGEKKTFFLCIMKTAGKHENWRQMLL